MPILLPILLFAAAAAPYDVVIRNGHVIDITGSRQYLESSPQAGGGIVYPWASRR